MADRPVVGLTPADVASLPAEQLPALLAGLAALQGAVAARLAAIPSVPAVQGRASGDERRWLTPDQAAEIANVRRRVVYGWSRRLDWREFACRPSRKALRIEERGFRRWFERQPPR